MKKDFYSNGKLLITGEYVVLDGAFSLALPTKYGQNLSINPNDEPNTIKWTSIDENDAIWFECEFDLKDNEILCSVQNNNDLTNRLIQILNAAKQLNPDFLNPSIGYTISTKLGFPRNWGLGSSSTLINNIARWAKVDPFKLLEKTFGGSGYDIAAAQNNNPIVYNLSKDKSTSKEVNLSWNFTNQIHFVYLNKKQNSRVGIANYRSLNKNKSSVIASINQLTSNFIACKNLSEFETLIYQHEKIISDIINIKPIKELMFLDYPGAIKSLGAWGGDFILVTGEKSKMDYFRHKGYKTILPYRDMIK